MSLKRTIFFLFCIFLQPQSIVDHAHKAGPVTPANIEITVDTAHDGIYSFFLNRLKLDNL